MKFSIFATSLFLSLASPSAFAAFGSHTVMCKIVSFDTEKTKLACDPNKPEKTMITPRAWIPEGTVVKSGTELTMSLTDEDFGKWLAMNEGQASKKGKKK